LIARASDGFAGAAALLAIKFKQRGVVMKRNDSRSRCLRWFIKLGVMGLLLSGWWCDFATAADVPATPPARLFNVWARCLANLETLEGRTALSVMLRWESNRLDAGLPVCSAQTPVIVGDRLVYRDLHQLRVADLASGKVFHSYDYVFPFVKGSAFAPVFAQQVGTDSPTLRRYLIGNSFNGLLSVDGSHVYFNESAGFSFTRSLARIVVDRPAEDFKPIWRLRNTQTRNHEPAADPVPVTWGHSFFGVPLLDGRRLFCISLHSPGELVGPLYANCFDRDSGELLWRRELTSDVRPSEQVTSYVMCLNDGVLIAQTESEDLVGLNSQSGEILWRYSVSGLASKYRDNALPSGCPNVPIVAQGKVLHLPMFGEALHCVDARTGQALWTAPRDEQFRESAAEYLAAVTHDSVLVVSRQRCRLLSLNNGEERWQRKLAAAPSGRGVLIGGNYVLPLGRAPLLSIKLTDGQAEELAWPIKDSVPGNLLASGDFVVSLGRTEVRVVSRCEPSPNVERPQYVPVASSPTIVSIGAGKPPTEHTDDPTGKLKFKATADRGQLLDAQTGQPTGVSVALKGTRIDMPITCWAFSPDSKFVAVGIGWKKKYRSGTEDNFGNVGVFDVRSGECILTTAQRMGFVHKVGFSQESRAVFYEAEQHKIDGP
jgi:outer membrane protein assembly factor BamB